MPKFEAQATPKKGYIRVEPIDTALSETSKKPLQNKAIYTELKLDKVTDKSLVLDTEIAHLVALDTQAELDIKFGAKEDIANKGVANGYAPLNASGIIDATYVPSAYTDYIEYATYADLPATGDEGTLYVVIADETSGDNTSTYRWTGSVYVNVTDKLSASEVKALYESNADTNAYTDTEKTKLTGIKDGAQVNVIEKIKIDGIDLTPDIDKRITLPNKVASVNGKMGVVDLDGTDIQLGGGVTTTIQAEFIVIDNRIDVIESKIDVIGLDYKEYGVREVAGQSTSEFERVTRFGGNQVR